MNYVSVYAINTFFLLAVDFVFKTIYQLYRSV